MKNIQIRFDLVEDCSGSMDSAKRTALKMITVLMLEAADLFEQEINQLFNFGERVRIDTQIWAFGSPGATGLLKSLRSSFGYNDQIELSKRLAMFGQLAVGLGSTWDADSWQLIAESVSEAEQKMIKDGRLRIFSIEITDGGSDNPQATRNAVSTAEDRGVIARAFQVGQTSEDEKSRFDQVWGIDQQDNLPKGQKIENLADLVPAFTHLFIEQMKKNMPLRLERRGE